MIRRARLLCVVTALLCGAVGVISSTQTWLVVFLVEGGDSSLPVPGASAPAVLAPLSLAVLALGLALSIVGTVLRYLFGALSIIIGGLLGVLSGVIAFTTPISAVTSTVTTATGISGTAAISELVGRIDQTPWPMLTLLVAAILTLSGVLTLCTARHWSGSGRRYATGAASGVERASATQTLDAIDSWDDLSRGEDPTSAGERR